MAMSFQEVIKYFPVIFNTNLRPCLMGHTGIGKTELVKQYARDNKMDLIIIHVAQLEPSDFVGLYTINDDKRTNNCPPAWLPYRNLDEATIKELDKSKGMSLEDVMPTDGGFINPNGGIVFLDEVNRAHEDMRQALYQFLQDKRIHTYELPDNYQIVCAANPASEGYEGYEFDPALVNRLAWVNFRPSFEETKTYLEAQYGRNPITSWIDSNKDLVEYGDDFQIEDLRYTPRMTENHIKVYNACRKEGKEFKRKVFETIMPKEKVQSFMSYLEEIEYINYKDVMNGVKGDKKKKLETLLKDNRMDILSTITMDLAEFFESYNLGDGSKLFKDEKAAIQNTVDFLDSVKDEQCCAFIDGLKKSYDNPKSIVNDAYFLKVLKPKLKKYRHVFA